MRLLAYIRVSTEDQVKDGLSLEIQPQLLKQQAKLDGHTIVDALVDEGVSAGKVRLAKRKAGAELIRRLKAGEADGVIAVRLDRLFRQHIDGLLFFDEFADRFGIQVLTLRERVDTSTARGRFQLAMDLAMAQYERDLTVERAIEHSRGMRQQGRVFGTTPFGCTNVGGLLYRDPGQWERREYIVDMYRTGGMSYRTLKSHLHDLRVLSPTGCAWWSTSTIKAVIDTHDSLAHLPLLAEQGGESVPDSPEGDVPRDANTAHNIH